MHLARLSSPYGSLYLRGSRQKDVKILIYASSLTRSHSKPDRKCDMQSQAYRGTLTGRRNEHNKYTVTLFSGIPNELKLGAFSHLPHTSISCQSTIPGGTNAVQHIHRHRSPVNVVCLGSVQHKQTHTIYFRLTAGTALPHAISPLQAGGGPNKQNIRSSARYSIIFDR